MNLLVHLLTRGQNFSQRVKQLHFSHLPRQFLKPHKIVCLFILFLFFFVIETWERAFLN